MGLTSLELKERRHYIGASDVATIMGLNQYQNPMSLWLEKTERIEPEPGDASTSLGTRLEPVILEFAEEELGPLERNRRIVADNDLDLDFPLSVQCDGLTRERYPVEAKTMGLFNNFLPELADWGDEFTDQVPDVYSVQVNAQMIATETDIAHIYAFLAGRGICAFEIRRSSIVEESIRRHCGTFWDDVQADREPVGGPPITLEVAKRFKRVPDKIITLSESAYQKWQTLDGWKSAAKSAEANIDGLKAEILEELADAEGGILPDGRLITYLETVRHNKAREAYDSTFRVLRIKGKANPLRVIDSGVVPCEEASE